MAYGRNQFIDHKTGQTYSWIVNHTTEEQMGKGTRHRARCAHGG